MAKGTNKCLNTAEEPCGWHLFAQHSNILSIVDSVHLLLWMTITKQQLRFSNNTAFGSLPVTPALTARFTMATRWHWTAGSWKIYLVDIRPTRRPRCICFHLCIQEISYTLTLQYCIKIFTIINDILWISNNKEYQILFNLIYIYWSVPACSSFSRLAG